VRNFLSSDDLIDPVRAAFGSDRRPRSVTRLEGGTTKGVYRVMLDDGTTTLAYRWHPDENFWPAQTVLNVGPFVADAGRASFVERNRLLTGLGVRVPKLCYAPESGDLALVEDLPGGTLEALLERDPAAGHAALERLASMLRITPFPARRPRVSSPSAAAGRWSRPRRAFRASRQFKTGSSTS
jgi:aminoglycoside/choline kinase family phosphotransferase